MNRLPGPPARIVQDTDSRLGEPVDATTIVLHNQGLAQLPAAVESFTNLRSLDISFNKISSLEGFKALQTLRQLKVYNNCLSSTSYIAPLTLLQYLDVSCNAVRSLQGLRHLRQLQYLDVSDCGLVDLQGVSQLPVLKTLYAGSNRLKDLDIGPCKQLQDLCVSSNQLTSMKGVHQCSAISSIDVSNNLLTSLEGLKGMRSLDILNVNTNCLRSLHTLPDGMALSELDVGNNQLSSLEKLAVACTELQLLDASLNSLQDVALLCQWLQPLSELVVVSLEGNQLASGYETGIMAAIPTVSTVSGVERHAPCGDAAASTEYPEHPVADSDGRFDPTVEEMEQYKQLMGITSSMPILGRARSASGSQRSDAARLSRPSSGLCRNDSTDKKSALMYARPQSARSRGSSAGGMCATGLQFDDFQLDVTARHEKLLGSLKHIRSSLQKPVSEALAQLTGGSQDQGVPALLMPLPSSSGLPGPLGKRPQPAGIKGRSTTAQGAASITAPHPYSIESDPDVAAALQLYEKLYASTSPSKEPMDTSGGLAHLQGSCHQHPEPHAAPEEQAISLDGPSASDTAPSTTTWGAEVDATCAAASDIAATQTGGGAVQQRGHPQQEAVGQAPDTLQSNLSEEVALMKRTMPRNVQTACSLSGPSKVGSRAMSRSQSLSQVPSPSARRAGVQTTPKRLSVVPGSAKQPRVYGGILSGNAAQ